MKKTQTNTYDSSLVTSSTYIYGEKKLYVELNGNTYQYDDVTLEDYKKFSEADSQGKALNSVIKPKYKFKKCEKLDNPLNEIEFWGEDMSGNSFIDFKTELDEGDTLKNLAESYDNR